MKKLHVWYPVLLNDVNGVTAADVMKLHSINQGYAKPNPLSSTEANIFIASGPFNDVISSTIRSYKSDTSPNYLLVHVACLYNCCAMRAALPAVAILHL